MRLKTIFWLALIGLILYSGFALVVPYVKSEIFEGEMKDQAHLMAVVSPETVKTRLLNTASSYSLPITEDALIVTKDEQGYVLLETQYSITVRLPFGYTHVYHFHPKVVQKVATGPGIGF